MKTLFQLLACGFLSISLSAQTRESRPSINRIDHAVVSVSNIKTARDFYSAKLGLNEGGPGCDAPRLPNCFTVNWVTRQHVILKESSSCPKNNCLDEVVFETTDATKLRLFLLARGVKVGELHKEDNYSLSFQMGDPDGHQIGFTQTILVPINDPGFDVKVSYGHIIHAGFIVRDRAAMDHFYKDILGFRPYWHGGMTDDETTWVSLQVPDGTDWLEFMLYDPTGKDKHFLGVMNHIALGVTDIQAAKTQLIKNGWKPTEEPKLGRDGKWQLNVYDPDDTRIEFMEFTPKEKPCCSEFTGPHPKP